MNAPQAVRALFGAIDAGDLIAARAAMSDRFRRASTRSPEPMGPDAWLDGYRPLVAAFPGMSHAIEDLEGNETDASGAFRVRGVHRGRLIIPALGIDLAPTGRAFELPREPFRARARDGLVTAMDVENPPGGGLDGVLDQIGGAEPPTGSS
ncbi:MAG: nuclear transport factor 2 family protein [Miltoncostaeaceae bacterium]